MISIFLIQITIEKDLFIKKVWPRTPDIYFKYDSKIEFESRCDEVVSWFRKFKMDFSTLYFNEPDSTGHEVKFIFMLKEKTKSLFLLIYYQIKHGPDSQEYVDKV